MIEPPTPAFRDFARIIELLPWPAALLSPQGRVSDVNSAMQATFSRPLAYPRPELCALFPEYCAGLQGDPPWSLAQDADVVRQSPSGLLHERVSIRLLDQGALLLVADQTRLQQLEQGYAQNARLASLGFLLASVSHEINNPLAAINSMVQILQSKRGVTGEVRQQGTRLIAENVRRLLIITRKLTRFARVDESVRKPFPVDAAIDEAFLQLRYDSLGETIEFEHQRDPGALVLGYQEQLQQVLFNLFLNAAQAMNGRGKLTVLTESLQPDEVGISISDGGPGISTMHLERIFEPFFTTKPSGDGIGLGLAISNEIVQEHGGKLSATNASGGGAVFQLKLPAAPLIRGDDPR